MDRFLDWAFQLWPPWMTWFIVLWSYVMVLVGSFFVVFTSVLAIRHYGYGSPIYDNETGEISTPWQTFITFLTFASIGAFCAALGFLVLRWKSG